MTKLRVLLLALLVLAAFGLRLVQLDGQDLWWDEARNIDVATRPLARIATAPELDIHPPLYFYVLHGWLKPAGGDVTSAAVAFPARYLSLWFGVLLVPLAYALGRRAVGTWAGLGAAVAAAASPFLLGEAQEARMYTMTLALLAAAGLALAVAAGPRRADRPGGWRSLLPWGAFALFSALAVLVHYAAVFALAALWGWAAAWALAAPGPQRRARLARLAGAAAAAALLVLPVLPIALRQAPTYRNPNLVTPSVAAYLAELGRVYGLGDHLDPAAAGPLQALLAGLLVVGWGLAARAAVRGELRPAVPGLALAWALVPLAVYYLVIRDRATFASRYISVALPGWLLLAGCALEGWARPPRRPSRFAFPVSGPPTSPVLGVLALLALVLALAPGIWGDLTDPRFFREDTRGLAAWLKAEADPARDLVLVDQRYPFGFYYERWNNDPAGFPPAEPAGLAPSQYLFVDINTVADRLNALAQGRRRIFWVRWFESDTDPRGAVPFLLEKFGARLGERAFRGYAVSIYALGEGTRFELAPPLGGDAALFGDQLRLAGYAFGGRGPGTASSIAETRQPQAPADKAIWLAVRWNALPAAASSARVLPRGLKAAVVLEDAGGLVVGRDDRPILNDRHLAPSQWSAADAPLGVYLVQPAAATPPGVYTLKLAVYDPVTLQQLPAGRGTFVTLGQVTLTRATRPPAIEELPDLTPVALEWRGLRLLGRGPLPAQAAPGERLSFDLYWQAERGGLPDLRARLSLRPEALPPRDAGLAGGYATFLWEAGEIVRDHQRWLLDPTLAEGAYTIELRLVDAATGEASPPAILGALAVAGRPHVFEPPEDVGRPSGATIGGFARVLGFRYALDRRPGREAALELRVIWQAAGPAEAAYTVSAQLLTGGVLAAQRDQPPGGGAFPTTGWVAGEVLDDAYRIVLPADLPAGRYLLVLKMYDPGTGAALPVTGPDGSALGELLPLTEIDIR